MAKRTRQVDGYTLPFEDVHLQGVAALIEPLAIWANAAEHACRPTHLLDKLRFPQPNEQEVVERASLFLREVEDGNKAALVLVLASLCADLGDCMALP